MGAVCPEERKVQTRITRRKVQGASSLLLSATCPEPGRLGDMKIDPQMDLTELAEHMGGASVTEARRLRDALQTRSRARTEDFTGEEWAQLVLDASDGSKGQD